MATRGRSGYRAYARPKGHPRFATVEGELDELLRFAPTYKLLEEASSDTALGRLGAKMSVWEVTTVYPLIFVISTANVEEETKESLCLLTFGS